MDDNIEINNFDTASIANLSIIKDTNLNTTRNTLDESSSVKLNLTVPSEALIPKTKSTKNPTVSAFNLTKIFKVLFAIGIIAGGIFLFDYIGGLRNENKKLNQLNKTLTISKQNTESEIKNYLKKNGEVEEEKKNLQKINEKLTLTEKSHQDAILSLQSKYKLEAEKSETLKQEKEELIEAKQKLYEENVFLKKENQILQIQSSEADLDTMEQIFSLQDELNTVKTQNQGLRQDLSECRSSLNSKVKESKELESQIRNLNLRNRELENNASTILKDIINSKIVTTSDEYNVLKKFFSDINQNGMTFKLLFAPENDLNSLEKFKESVSTTTPTMVLIETTSGRKFGGFTTQSWESVSRYSFFYDDDYYKTDEKAFLFSFYYEKRYDVKNPNLAIKTDEDYLIVFGENDLLIQKNFFHLESKSKFPNNYLYDGKKPKKNELTGEAKFLIKHLEVFEVNFK